MAEAAVVCVGHLGTLEGHSRGAAPRLKMVALPASSEADWGPCVLGALLALGTRTNWATPSLPPNPLNVAMGLEHPPQALGDLRSTQSPPSYDPGNVTLASPETHGQLPRVPRTKAKAGHMCLTGTSHVEAGTVDTVKIAGRGMHGLDQSTLPVLLCSGQGTHGIKDHMTDFRSGPGHGWGPGKKPYAVGGLATSSSLPKASYKFLESKEVDNVHFLVLGGQGLMKEGQGVVRGIQGC